MTAVQLPLDPAQPSHRADFSMTPEGALRHQFDAHAWNTLACELAAPVFDRERFLSSIINLANSGESTVLTSGIYGPFPAGCDAPLIDSVTSTLSLPVAEATLDTISFPRDFMRSIRRSFGSRGLDMTTLEQMHERSYAGTPIANLWNRLSELYTPGQQFPVAEVFDLVDQAIGKPGYGLAVETAQDLYLVTFLPRWMRLATQELVVSETLALQMEKLKEWNPSPVAQRFFDKITDYWREHVLTSEHWFELIEQVENLAVTERVAQRRMESLGTLQELFQLRQLPEGAAALEQYGAMAKELTQSLYQFHRQSTCRGWQSTDIGHAFYGFWTDSLVELRATHTPELGIKNGSRAVVLEDSPEQGARWLEMLDLYSSASVLPSGRSLCRMPTDIAPFIANPAVNLFLIDIQNPQNPRAGIEVAERILRERMDWPVPRLDARATTSTTVIVWSHSPQALEDANQSLEKLIKTELDPERKKISGFGCYNHTPVKIDVLAKGSPLVLYAIA